MCAVPLFHMNPDRLVDHCDVVLESDGGRHYLSLGKK